MADKDEYGQAPACNGCINWDQFGKKCWVYWNLKKECSHHTDGYSKVGTPDDAVHSLPKQSELQNIEDAKEKRDNNI